MANATNNNDLLYFSPPSFPEKHKDSFAKDRDELLNEVRAMRDTIELMRLSGHYSAKGLAFAIGARLTAAQKVFAEFEKNTVGRIDKHVAEETAAALKPKPSTEDPQVRFHRLHAKRALLDQEAPLDPKTNRRDTLKLQVRLRQVVDQGGGEELLAALTLLEPEFPIAPPELINQTRLAIAEKTHPELGDYAQLRSAYTFIIGAAANEMTQLAQTHGVDQHTIGHKQEPYLVSTGEPVGKE
jgi:hypothetical protein